jgi:hypothetical protein
MRLARDDECVLEVAGTVLVSAKPVIFKRGIL